MVPEPEDYERVIAFVISVSIILVIYLLKTFVF